jgi:hypothetical protein
MPDDVEQQLTVAAQAVHELQAANQRSAELTGRQDQLASQLDQLRAQFSAEQKDVSRLEGMSLTHVLAALHGSREDKLGREKAEAAAASLRVTEAEKQLQAVGDALQAARQQAAALAGAPDQYAQAMAAKEQYLTQSADPRAHELLSLADERGRLTGELNEITEAAQTAASAQHALAAVQNKLGSAQSWSTYDTYFRGGIVASAIKHSRLDDAAALAAEADRRLATLRTELTVAGQLAPQLAVGGGTRFVDIWFNNIFSDFAFQDHLRDARQNTSAAIQTVGGVQRQLNARREQVTSRLSVIATHREELLRG